jgi:DNA-binding transcriptional MocR family regulator
MATRAVELTVDWVKLTNGDQSAYLQVEEGMVYWCDSDNRPSQDAVVHRLLDEVRFSPPVNIWIRSGPHGKTRVIVTLWGSGSGSNNA